MKKKTNIRQVIRTIVREEVAMAIGEVITELKQPTQQVSKPKQKKKVVEGKRKYQKFTENSVLNDWLIKNGVYVSDDLQSFSDGSIPIHSRGGILIIDEDLKIVSI